MPVIIQDLTVEPVAEERRAEGVWGPYAGDGWGTKPTERPPGAPPSLPANQWAAELEGYEPTEEDRETWRDNVSPERELGPLQRSGDLGWCDYTRSDGSQDRSACWSSPFKDLF